MQTAWRVRGGGVPAAPCRSFTRVRNRRRGFSIVELVTVVGLAGVILGMAIPNIPRGTYDLWGAQTQFLGDIRTARTMALTKGDHYRLVVTGVHSYEVRRMELLASTWVDRHIAPIISRTLPSTISFTDGLSNAYEFNTRGLLVDTAVAGDLHMSDSRSGRTRGVTVWPSGQVKALAAS